MQRQKPVGSKVQKKESKPMYHILLLDQNIAKVIWELWSCLSYWVFTYFVFSKILFLGTQVYDVSDKFDAKSFLVNLTYEAVS